MQQPYKQNQQVPIIHAQWALAQNPIQTNPTADQSWHILNQQGLQNEQRCNQGPNITVEPIKWTAFEQVQFGNPHFQQSQNFQSPANRYGQPLAQSTSLRKSKYYIVHLPNVAAQA